MKVKTFIIIIIVIASRPCLGQQVVNICDLILHNSSEDTSFTFCNIDTSNIIQLDSLIESIEDIGLDFGYTKTFVMAESKFVFYSNNSNFDDYELDQISIFNTNLAISNLASPTDLDSINLNIDNSIFSNILEIINEAHMCVALDNYYRLNYYLDENDAIRVISLTRND